VVRHQQGTDRRALNNYVIPGGATGSAQARPGNDDILSARCETARRLFG